MEFAEIVKDFKDNTQKMGLPKIILIVGGLIILITVLLRRKAQTPKVSESEVPQFQNETSAFNSLTEALTNMTTRTDAAFQSVMKGYETGTSQLGALTSESMKALAQVTATSINNLGKAVETQGANIDKRFTTLETALSTQFASLTTGIANTINHQTEVIDAKFTGLNTNLTNQFATMANVISSAMDTVKTLPGKDYQYLMLGSQSTASCFVPNSNIGSLECYNIKAPFDNLPYINSDNYQQARPSVQNRWGNYVKNGQFDLVAIGKQIASEKGIVQ